MTKNDKIMSLVMSVFFILFSVSMLIVSFVTESHVVREGITPMGFPRLVLGFILFFSIGSLGFSAAALRKSTRDEEKGAPILPVRAIIDVVSMVMYVLLWNVIGFSLSTVLFITGLSKYLNTSRKWWHCLLVAVIFAVIINVVFVQMFAIIFPEPLWDMIMRY